MDLQGRIIKKRDAAKAGMKFYFTGKPCKKSGHISYRYTSTGACCECSKHQSKQNYESNKCKASERHARYYRQNVNAVMATKKAYREKNKYKWRAWRANKRGNKPAWFGEFDMFVSMEAG